MKKKIMVIAVVALTLAMLTAAVGCGSKDKETKETKETSLADIQKKGELVLGCDSEFPPMGFDDNGKIVGFDIDLAQEVANKLDVKLVVKPIDWKAKESLLMTKKIDVIWNGYTITADRVKKVCFTKPYLRNSQYLVVRADSDIKTKEDLKGDILGVQSESAAETLVNADEAFKSSLKELRVYDDYQDALNDLKSSKRIGAVGVDKILIEYVMKQSPNTFRILEEDLGEEYYGIGCRKEDKSLADAIDKALDDLQKEGKTTEISNSWFAGGQDAVIRDTERLTSKDF